MLLTEPPPASSADRSDRRLFETRHLGLLEHVSEHPASIWPRCRRLFEIETWRLLQVLR